MARGARARRRAAATSVVLTFDSSPGPALRAGPGAAAIMSLERRLELLAEAGSTSASSSRSRARSPPSRPRRSCARCWGAIWAPRDVVVGYDFSFGRGRPGDARAAGARWASALGHRRHGVPPVMVDGLICSSTKIREFVLEGRVEGAARAAGAAVRARPARWCAAPAGGAASASRPRTSPRRASCCRRSGIYAARARILDGARAGGAALAALSVGTNPTFADGRRGDRGGVPARLRRRSLRPAAAARARQRLRDERRFASVDALVAQIAPTSPASASYVS